MKFVIEGTSEELKEFFGEGAFFKFVNKDEFEDDDCSEEIPNEDMPKIKCLNTVAEALAKFLAEKDKH